MTTKPDPIRRSPARHSLPVPATVLLLALGGGCNYHPLKPVELNKYIVSDDPLDLDVDKKIDVLVVIDDSGSMGPKQANLAANFGPFIEHLEEAGADYRIAFTTTDMGGPGCESPSGGSLWLSSCMDRHDDFVSATDDQFEIACAAHCELGDAELTVVPTMIESGGEAAPRPWLESVNGVDNLPPDVEMLEAFQCFAPQGISGCGWESPLESMKQALANMQNPSRPEYGFLRDDAVLAVLIVTDEVDCSHDAGFNDALFGSGTFFADGLDYATSAVCWNAGVTCTGDSPYIECVDDDIGSDGQLTPDPDAAVLYPVSRYVEALEDVFATKSSGRDVLVSVIAGVPSGYNTGAAEQVFIDSNDEFEQTFGIGPGCEAEVAGVTLTGVPPVRLVTFASAFAASSLPEGHRNLYSVCDADYTPAITDIVESFVRVLPPACVPECVYDQDPTTEALDYECDVLESVGGSDDNLPECEHGAQGAELPTDVDACWIAITGDELSDGCVAMQSNLEVKLLRRPGVPVADGTVVSAACLLSAHPQLDCG